MTKTSRGYWVFLHLLLFVFVVKIKFFVNHETIVEHHIIRDHETNWSRGFGFVILSVKRFVS